MQTAEGMSSSDALDMRDFFFSENQDVEAEEEEKLEWFIVFFLSLTSEINIL